MRSRSTSSALVTLAFTATLGAPACRSRDAPEAAPASSKLDSAPAAASVAPQASIDQPPFIPAPDDRSAPRARVAPAREGAALARSPGDDRLYVADEDHACLRVRRLPLGVETATTLALPGRPANMVVAGDRVLVTVRDPSSLLLFLRADPVHGLVEVSRTELPDDAWGLALSADGATAFVTSAWSHAVSAVDVASGKLLWSLDVAREPRGIVALPSGVVYVSHLTSSALTRVEVRDGKPSARTIVLPAAPLRAPRGKALDASLGYALAVSPDRSRLFAARHALGALGDAAWFGAATVDVLLTQGDTPLAPARPAESVVEAQPVRMPDDSTIANEDPLLDGPLGPLPLGAVAPFVQPRAMALAETRERLYVASEGTRDLVELDARTVAPALGGYRRIGLGSSCGAPSGVALSADEATAYVWCRTTGVVVEVPLARPGAATAHPIFVDAQDDVTLGRRLFFDATDRVSGGLGCAGCHPDGRDDGHVWHEVTTERIPKARRGAGRAWSSSPIARRIFTGDAETIGVPGFPRQTPMLAGRLASPGPYGWLGRNKDIEARIVEGASLHRWFDAVAPDDATVHALAAFVRKGLTPPRGSRPAVGDALRGKAIFERGDVACTSCHHVGADATPAQLAHLTARASPPGFDAEDVDLKVPSLLFAGGTPPYMHDGSDATLEDVVEREGDRMGKTRQLSPEDRAALVAYLRSL